MAVMKRPQVTNDDENVEKREPQYIVTGNIS